MVVVGMSPMPLKIIGKNAYSQVKGPLRLLKDLGPKRCRKHLKEGGVKRNDKTYESGKGRCAM
jgi:hypothetical protein